MKKTTCSLILLYLSAAIGFSQNSLTSGSGYLNPVIPGFHPDPSICRVGDDFYLVNSTFQYFPGVPVFHSKDLIHWEQSGNALDRTSQLSLAGANVYGGIYAPTIRFHEGLYYLVVGNVTANKTMIVTAENPEGPWSEPIWLEQGGGDPSLFWEDGRCYFCCTGDRIFLCEIDERTGKRLTPMREIWRGDGGRYPEGPHIFKKDGWYYLMISEGGCEFGHSETIARSRDIYGPYETNPDNPILCNQRQRTQGCEIQGTGHADLVQSADGRWWMVLLAFRTQNGNHHLMGRETCMVPVEWAGEWPVVNIDGRVEPVMSVETLPQVWPDGKPIEGSAPSGIYKSDGNGAWSMSEDRLSDGKFGPEWIWLNNPSMENYRFEGKELLITSSTVTLDEGGISPSFVSLRQRCKNAEPWTVLSMDDAAEGDKAGISVYMSDFAHCDLYVEKGRKGTQTVRMTYTGLGGLVHEFGEVKAAKGDVTLHIISSGSGYAMECTDSEGKKTNLGSLDCRYLSTETVGGFTGIVFGLYAVNSSSGKPFTARFKEFRLNDTDR